MQLSAIGLSLDDLDTPALLLDLDALGRNIEIMAGRFRAHGLAWRPHAKAFKCPAIAHRLRKAGAIGVTVAKVSEAEVMAAAGIDDILIAHLVVGPDRPELVDQVLPQIGQQLGDSTAKLVPGVRQDVEGRDEGGRLGLSLAVEARVEVERELGPVARQGR